MIKALVTAAILLAPVVLGTPPALAAQDTDPANLVPAPPPAADCKQAGNYVICQTTFNVFNENEPIFDLPCGTVYDTSVDLRNGIRWYLEGKLVKRVVRRQSTGTWSLSPTVDAPVVKVTSHGGWGEVYPVPGDESSQVGAAHGADLTVSAADYGVIAHIAGRDSADGFRGTFMAPEDAEVAAELCAALGG